MKLSRSFEWGSFTYGALACAAALSCNAIIGTKDLFFDADGGGPPAEGGGVPDTGGPPPADGGVPDATIDSPSGGDGGPCSDTTTSPTDCGRCGHSCLGGTCVASQCQPVALASNISPRDIAVDQNHVYWLEPATALAMQIDKDGKNSIQLKIARPRRWRAREDSNP